MAATSPWPAIVRDLMEQTGTSEREMASLVGISRMTLRSFLAGNEQCFNCRSLEKALAIFGYELEAIEREIA